MVIYLILKSSIVFPSNVICTLSPGLSPRKRKDNIKGYIGTHHDDVAMGEVEHFGNSVHHSIPQGNDGVDAPHADAVDQVGQKFHTRSHLSLFPVMAGTRERRCAVLTGPAAETQGGCQVSPRQYLTALRWEGSFQI